MGLLTLEERSTIVTLLCKLPNIEVLDVRWQLLGGLPLEVQGTVPRTTIPRVHLYQMVTTLDGPTDGDGAQLADGTWPIISFLERAEMIAPETALNLELRQVVEMLRARAAQSS